MNDQIEIIYKACIEANPDILALVPGCKVLWTNPSNEETKQKAKQWKCTVIRNWGNGAISIIDDFHVNTTQASSIVFEGDFDEIIGRPIRLTDILNAIRYFQTSYIDGVYLGGQFMKMESCVPDYGKYSFVLIGSKGDIVDRKVPENTEKIFWNFFKDDITLQSLETIAFIVELLK